MTKTLVLALSTDPGGPVLWAVGADGVLERWGRLDGPEEIGSLALGDVDAAVAVVPGEDVLLRTVELPAKRDAEARAAVPFLLEDDVAVDPEDLHFALGPLSEDGRRKVALTARGRMEAWRKALAGVNGPKTAIVPDFLALRPADKSFTLVEREGRVLGIDARGQGFAAETDLARLLGKSLAADASAIRLYTNDPTRLAPEEGWGAADVAVEPAPSDEAFLQALLTGLAAGTPLDLRQGAYANDNTWTAALMPWRRAGVLAALIVLVFGMLTLSEAWRYDRMADVMQARAETVLRDALPDVKRVVNPRAQLKAAMGEMQAGGTGRFLQLSSLLFQSIEDLPAIELRDIRYFSERQEIAASLTYESYTDLEGLKVAVTSNGGRFEEGGSRQVGDKIVGDVTLGLQR